MNLSPPIELSTLATKNGSIVVVRDDFLRGGTKQRAMIPFLQESGFKECVYASPFSGYAQVALAVSCKLLGIKCKIFAEKDQCDNKLLNFDSILVASEVTRSIAYIADVSIVHSLEKAEKFALDYAKADPNRTKLPLGINDPLFKSFLKIELTNQWDLLCKIIHRPRRLWVTVGSGTLAQILSEIIAPTKLVCVDVHVLQPEDSRIKKIKEIGDYISSPEIFVDPVTVNPPIPSNPYYDAKVWQFLENAAEAGDVWWNVAR